MLNNMMSLSFGQGGLHHNGNTQIKEIFIKNLDWQTIPTGLKHSCLFQIENKACTTPPSYLKVGPGTLIGSIF